MDALFKQGANVMAGYYGNIQFLDSQKVFDNTFGKEPALLPMSPTNVDANDNAKELLEFGKQCRLDVYMHACRQFYVGNAAVDTNTNMMEVCSEISKL